MRVVRNKTFNINWHLKSFIIFFKIKIQITLYSEAFTTCIFFKKYVHLITMTNVDVDKSFFFFFIRNLIIAYVLSVPKYLFYID